MSIHLFLSQALAAGVLLFLTGCVELNCPLPKTLAKYVQQEKLASASSAADIKRNNMHMSGLCANKISFVDHGTKWKLILVRNSKNPNGPFWFLPHDNENSALDAAVYASKKYGGGFLAVEARGQRYASGKDPNRNFIPSSAYTKTIFTIIDTFRSKGMPYLTLHSNKEGHMKFGGEGTVSMRVASKHTRSYPAGEIKKGRNEGLNDEDTLVYLAGTTIDQSKIKALNLQGIHVKYEIVNSKTYDRSMSNYVALYKNHTGYINIEAEEGDLSTHKKMIDRVVKLIYQGKL